MTWKYLFLVQFFVLSFRVKGSCSPGWVIYHDSCYMFSRLQMSWDKAKTTNKDLRFDILQKTKWAELSGHELHCQILGTKLAEIETLEEENFLRLHLLDSFPKVGLQGFWLGAKDDAKEGTWKWINANEPVEITDWAPGEPNNKDSEEDCLEYWAEQQYRWNDAPCRLERDFICEETL